MVLWGSASPFVTGAELGLLSPTPKIRCAGESRCFQTQSQGCRSVSRATFQGLFFQEKPIFWLNIWKLVSHGLVFVPGPLPVIYNWFLWVAGKKASFLIIVNGVFGFHPWHMLALLEILIWVAKWELPRVKDQLKSVFFTALRINQGVRTQEDSWF